MVVLVGRCGWWGVVGVTPNGPCWVSIEAEGLVDLFQFGLLPLLAGGDSVGASGEGSDGGTFVRRGLVRVPGYVLVGVGRLPIHVELQRAILLAQDGEVQHVDASVDLRFKCPLDLLVDAVEEGEEGGDVVMVNGCHGIIGLTKPEEDDANRRGGWWGVRGGVDEAVSGEDIRLKLRHEGI